jgi:hypothetical protein
MTPEEVRFVVSAASGLGVGILVAGLIAWLLLKHYIPSYLNEKGKNLATKEDVAAITHEVERVRLEYNTLMEEVRARNQLRMAALDKRLQAHQEAFALWRKLTGRSAQPADVIMECQTWWETHCLYLEPEVRQAFLVAYHNEGTRDEFVRIGAEAKLIQEAWAKVIAFPAVLFKAIKLPPLSESETESLDTKDPASPGANA